jgi:hypothetical protein
MAANLGCDHHGATDVGVARLDVDDLGARYAKISEPLKQVRVPSALHPGEQPRSSTKAAG